MLLSFLLLFQFKQSLCFSPFLFPALHLAFLLVLLMQQFQSLLRFRPNSMLLHLPLYSPLHPLGILLRVLNSSRHSRTELQMIVMLQNELIHLVIFRFSAKNNLGCGQLIIFNFLKGSYPEWFFKEYG